MKQITSRDNAVYKSIRRLVRSARGRREEGRIVLDGVHLVQAYLERFGAEGVELVIRESAAQLSEVKALAERTTSATMSDALFDQVAPVQSPLGILALAPLPQVIAPGDGQGFQVLLDGLQDPGNIGAILRSAAAAGARMAHLSADCADPWSPKCLRGGMGAQFLLALQEHHSLAVAAGSLGVRLIACTADAPMSLFDADLRGDVGFIIGGEGAGVSPELLAQAHQKIRVPMRAGIESLNAGAAAAVCFYEWVRQARI
jgi:TrmH family RNA methyltransferase